MNDIDVADEIIGRFRHVPVSTVYTGTIRNGFHPCYMRGVQNYTPGQKLVGRARTLRFLPPRVDLVAEIRGGVKGAMGQDHRVINQKGLFLVFIDKVANEVGADLRPVFTTGEVLLITVEFQLRVDKASVDRLAVLLGSSAAGMLPEAGFLEAEMLRCISLLSELPLTGDRGGVPSLFELMGEGGLPAI